VVQPVSRRDVLNYSLPTAAGAIAVLPR
jgi:hypothetical protein